MNSIDLLRNSHNIAIIGVSEQTDKYGYKIFKKLLDLNYHVYGISPKYKDVDNHPLYTSLKDIPHSIDFVVFVVNKNYALPYLNEMVDLHIPYAWMQPNTYDETLLNTINDLGINSVLDCVLVQSNNL